jgi:hypothetical protein
VTGHCPDCGEPVIFVSISTRVAAAIQACPCHVKPDLIGPEVTSSERNLAIFTYPLQRTDSEPDATLDGPLDV